MTRPNLNQYTLEELETMEIRELYALTEHWAKAFEDNTFSNPEIEKVRKATGIYIRRREALRAAAPAMLIALERVIVYIESAGLIPPCVREGRKVLAQAKGGG